MTLPPSIITGLADWLAATDLTELELRGPGVHLRLRNHAGTVTEVKAPGITVLAPNAGIFLPAHPLHDMPIAPPGTRVATGQPLAFLQIGTLLLPVPASCHALIAGHLASPGALVGYGAPLVELHPVAE